MSNHEKGWNRLTAAVRQTAGYQVVPAPEPAWVTRVAALGAEAIRRYRALPMWLAWTTPALGVAVVIAAVAVFGLRHDVVEPNGSEQLVALADPLAGGALFP